MKKKVFLFIFALLLLVLQSIYLKGEDKPSDTDKLFGDIGFGVGISTTLTGERIKTAEIINDNVTIIEASKYEPKFVIEAHLLISSKDDSGDVSARSTVPINKIKFGLGPFVCVVSGKESFIESFGGGIMFGIRKVNSKIAFNIGVGVIVDTDFKELATGFSDGETLLVGETNIRYKTHNKARLQIIVSFNI